MSLMPAGSRSVLSGTQERKARLYNQEHAYRGAYAYTVAAAPRSNRSASAPAFP